MQRLQNKIAIVTGGGGGIGTAVVARLVSEGARVAVADIFEESAQASAAPHGDNAIALKFDATDPASVEAMINHVVKHFGKLDILHNNAGTAHPEDSNAPDISLDLWNDTMSLNVTGYLLGCKYALPHMIAAGSGVIINTASGSGILGDLARIAYGTSKGAVIALTKYIATQHGHQGIRCNAIAPGVIMTDAMHRNAPGIAELIGPHLLTRRFGKPDDIAALAAYLASDESGYITGECINIDGGAMAHQPHYAALAAAMQLKP